MDLLREYGLTISAGIVFGAVPALVFIGAIFFSAPVTWDDCDLCGRKKIVRNRHVGKASASHMCSDCYRTEVNSARKYGGQIQ